MPEPVAIVGIGGSTRPDSSTKRLVRTVLDAVEARGARTTLFSGEDLLLPAYDPFELTRPPGALTMIEEIRQADGVVIGSPGYHGSISGLMKNVLDYLEDMRDDARPYLDDKPVGCVVAAYGWQATVTTLVTLRQIVHALRGWPTPLGLAVNVAATPLPPDGSLTDKRLLDSVAIMADQLVTFAERSRVAEKANRAGRS